MFDWLWALYALLVCVALVWGVVSSLRQIEDARATLLYGLVRADPATLRRVSRDAQWAHNELDALRTAQRYIKEAATYSWVGIGLAAGLSIGALALSLMGWHGLVPKLIAGTAGMQEFALLGIVSLAAAGAPVVLRVTVRANARNVEEYFARRQLPRAMRDDQIQNARAAPVSAVAGDTAQVQAPPRRSRDRGDSEGAPSSKSAHVLTMFITYLIGEAFRELQALTEHLERDKRRAPSLQEQLCAWAIDLTHTRVLRSETSFAPRRTRPGRARWTTTPARTWLVGLGVPERDVTDSLISRCISAAVSERESPIGVSLTSHGGPSIGLLIREIKEAHSALGKTTADSRTRYGQDVRRDFWRSRRATVRLGSEAGPVVAVRVRGATWAERPPAVGLLLIFPLSISKEAKAALLGGDVLHVQWKHRGAVEKVCVCATHVTRADPQFLPAHYRVAAIANHHGLVHPPRWPFPPLTIPLPEPPPPVGLA